MSLTSFVKSILPKPIISTPPASTPKPPASTPAPHTSQTTGTGYNPATHSNTGSSGSSGSGSYVYVSNVQTAKPVSTTTSANVESKTQQAIASAKAGEPTKEQIKTPTRSSIVYEQPPYNPKDYPIHHPGTIYQYQSEGYNYEGKQIPIVKTFTVGSNWTSSKATSQEEKQLFDYINAEQYKEVALIPASPKWKTTIGETYGSYQKLSSEPIYNVKATQALFSKGGKVGEFAGGIVTGIVPSTKGELITTGVITGVSAGTGFAFKGIISGATLGATKLFGKTAGRLTSTTLKIGATGAGVYYGGTYALSKAGEFSLAKSWGGKGKVFGTGIRETGSALLGFKLGSKGYDITEGLWGTRGRSLIDIPQGKYPSAPGKKQLELFRKNIYPELGKKPGAFHTTGQSFWKGGTITPEVGSSELPGLYGSTKISTPFTRIPGSGSKIKILPSVSNFISDLLRPPNKPAVAFLKPIGFRYSPAKVGKWYLPAKPGVGKWYLPAKPGYADVPGIKTEIESIFRPGAGSYNIESNKYYVKISGVRVPLDVFAYNLKSNLKGLNIPSTKVFNPSSYSSYKTPPLINPVSGISSYLRRSSYSFSSYTPSSSKISSNVRSSIKFRSSRILSSLSSSKLPRSRLNYGYSSLSNYGYSSSGLFGGSSSIRILRSKPPIVPPFNKPGFDTGTLGTRLFKTKQLFKYTPSYESFIFKIRGVVPRGTETGLRIRPIPKKFSFFRRIKL